MPAAMVRDALDGAGARSPSSSDADITDTLSRVRAWLDRDLADGLRFGTYAAGYTQMNRTARTTNEMVAP